MLRPLSWTERLEAVAGIADLELGVFTTEGDQIYTAPALEEDPTYYGAKIELDEDYAGQTLLLRWRSLAAGVNSIVSVFIAGERLAASVIAGVSGELPDPPAYEDDSLFSRTTGYLFNADDAAAISQYSAVYLDKVDRNGAVLTDNTVGEFFGIVQSSMDAGASQSMVVTGGPTQARCPAAEEWGYGDPVYVSGTPGLVTNNPDVLTPGVWVVEIGYAFAAKLVGITVGTIIISKTPKYVVAGAEE